MSIVPVFLYGTLQRGHWNYPLIEEDVLEAYERCTSPGQIWFAGPVGSYPYAKFFKRHRDTVTGSVLYLDQDSSGYQIMAEMEIGAGYELRPIVVTIPGEKDIVALAWHFPHPVDNLVRIAGGDWSAAMEALVQDEN